MLAETRTDLRKVLALKIHTFEAMAQILTEGTTSNAIYMVEAAMKSNAERLGIVLLLLPHAPTQAR